MRKAVDFETFNNNFFKGVFGSSINWFNRKGVYPLDKNRNVEITLITTGVVQTYTSYLVEIVDKLSGKITSHTFKFSDYMENRVDTRYDYKGPFLIIEHVCVNGVAEWYIAIPHEDDINSMASKIKQFIELYK